MIKGYYLVFCKFIAYIEVEVAAYDQRAICRLAVPRSEGGAAHQRHALQGVAYIVCGMIIHDALEFGAYITIVI